MALISRLDNAYNSAGFGQFQLRLMIRRVALIYAKGPRLSDKCGEGDYARRRRDHSSDRGTSLKVEYLLWGGEWPQSVYRFSSLDLELLLCFDDRCLFGLPELRAPYPAYSLSVLMFRQKTPHRGLRDLTESNIL